jgi:transposase, IS30 family
MRIKSTARDDFKNAAQSTPLAKPSLPTRYASTCSPEQISCALAASGWLGVPCHEWIYQFVYGKQGQALRLRAQLRFQKSYRKRGYKTIDRRGRLGKGACIHERPDVIEQRNRIGDLEGDTIIGKNHKGAALNLVDRKSLYVWIERWWAVC